MFKKGDVVEGIKSGAIYECLEDEKDGLVNCKCIVASPLPRTKAQLGYEAHLPSPNLKLVTSPPISAIEDLAIEEKTDDLVEMRRELKRLFSC